MVLAIANLKVVVNPDPNGTLLNNAGVPSERKLGSETNMNSGYFLNKLLQTHNLSNMAVLQTQRQDELGMFDKSFKNIDYKIDEFRDSISQKLLELKNSLERPKAPIMGMSNIMTRPYNHPLSSSELVRPSLMQPKVSLSALQNEFKTSFSKIQNAQNSLSSLSGFGHESISKPNSQSALSTDGDVERRLTQTVEQNNQQIKPTKLL